MDAGNRNARQRAFDLSNLYLHPGQLYSWKLKTLGGGPMGSANFRLCPRSSNPHTGHDKNATVSNSLTELPLDTRSRYSFQFTVYSRLLDE